MGPPALLALGCCLLPAWLLTCPCLACLAATGSCLQQGSSCAARLLALDCACPRPNDHRNWCFAARGLLLAASTHILSKALTHPAPSLPGVLRAGTSLVLAGVMGQRANRSGRVFPAGIVALVSALMTIGYAKALA